MSGMRLVTRADDAGMGRVANRAIRAAVKQGIVRNISLMAPTPEIEHAAEILLDLGDSVDFGLHVTLTAEWRNLRWGPVADPETVASLLRRDGTMPFTTTELAELGPDLEEMMREVTAQCEKLRGLGLGLKYLDEHMRVGHIRGLADRLTELAKKQGLIHSRRYMDSGLLTGLPGWDSPGSHPGTELADHLAGTVPGTYLVVGHPGFGEGEMNELHVPGQSAGEEMMARNRQRRMFADIEIVDYCDNTGIELLRYSDLES